MLRGIPVLNPYVNLYLNELDNECKNILKGVLRSKNMNLFIVVSSAVMVIHCCIWFEQKMSVVRDFKGRGIKSILKHLYLNDYAEFDSKISYNGFT